MDKWKLTTFLMSHPHFHCSLMVQKNHSDDGQIYIINSYSSCKKKKKNLPLSRSSQSISLKQKSWKQETGDSRRQWMNIVISIYPEQGDKGLCQILLEIHTVVVGWIHLWRGGLASMKLFCKYVWLLVMVFLLSKEKTEEHDVALRLRCSVWLCIRGICGGKLSRRAQQISSLLALEEYLPFSPDCISGCLCFRNPDFTHEFLVFGSRVLTFLFVSEGTKFPLLRQLSSHAHFPFVEPSLVFPLSFVVLEFWGSECYEASLLTVSTFGLLSGGTLCSCIKPNSPATSNMLKQSSVVTWRPSVLTRL